MFGTGQVTGLSPEDSRGQKLNTPICSVERLTAIMHIMVAVKLLLPIVKGQVLTSSTLVIIIALADSGL